jgi:hypothetical protein
MHGGFGSAREGGLLGTVFFGAGPPENTDVIPDRGSQNRKTKSRRYDTIVDLLAHPPRTHQNAESSKRPLSLLCRVRLCA